MSTQQGHGAPSEVSSRHWSSVHQQAFDTGKELLTTKVVLAHPDPSRAYYVHW